MSKRQRSLAIIFGIFFIALAVFVGVFFLLFRTDYKKDVFLASSENDVEKALIFSVIKAESKFLSNAKSSAGAIGLMQIKLSTANYMLLLENKSEITENELYLPENNIKLGTKYLKYLIDKFKDVNVSICAYNAGESIVSDWLKDRKFSLDGKTLQKIPFLETENYLNKVNFNYSIYKKIV